ncbi:expressed unknown protein [Seminavis robusta]|uniref:Uncharacterized protein n=1 Tax=Seminavis robusta TaxID=568900 RepID=A0A9N8E8W9_9STRA|nr:expressed unknown protein [Seminavis robusta]|eukprot:Sro785_g202110.1 n/a (531) ;mRNA; r:15921-17612
MDEDNTNSNSNQNVAMEQEAIVSRFASLMVSQASDLPPQPMNEWVKNDLLRCLGDSLSDDVVVCTLPCLDVKVTENSENPLPEVGQHMGEKERAASMKDQSGLHPIMEASVLSSGAEATTDGATKEVVEKKPTQTTTCNTSSWTKATIENAPSALLKNVADSFSSLVDSRVRSWTLLMLKQSLSSGDSASRTNLLKMLSATIKVASSMSTFKTLPLPPSAGGQSKEADVILPLIFEVAITISVGDKSEQVTLRAPGTVSGNFAPESPKGLSKVDIRLDSKALLGSMADKARLVVFKTVANVTSADLKAKKAEAEKPSAAPIGALSGGFSSSLRLTTVQATNSPRLAKARHSALKLNSVLQGTTAGKNADSGGIRKQRSVQWDHPMELPTIKGSSSTPPEPKKARVAQTATRLKSFKSFGRPHAEDSAAGPRNATFGNFGRGPIWGRDGKLANHPMPVNALERQRMDLMGAKVTGSVNATFGSPTSINPPSRLTAAGRSGSSGNMSARLPSSIPRTATALESWLLNASGGS